MRILLLVLALAGHASAEPPGQRALRARTILDSLPITARAELRKLYFRYVDAVSTHLDQGWKGGVLTESVIEGTDESFQPARLSQEAVAQRLKEVAALDETLSKSAPDAPGRAKTRRRLKETKAALAAARKKDSREKGVCRDWSDAVWAELNALEPVYWTVEDRRRQARPFHTGAIVCSIDEEPRRSICLVFDPWEEGQADVFALEAWDAHEEGGRIPADYFLHDLPEKAP